MAHTVALFVGVWIKGKVYRRKVDTADELLTGILDAAGWHKET
jgi:hypothetical protein